MMTTLRRMAAAMCAAAAIPAVAAAQTAPAERDVDVPAIAGVVAGDAEWIRVWQGKDTADGPVAAPDGSLLFAQEQTGTVIALAPDDSVSVHAWDTRGAGALSGDAQGRLYMVQRTCTDPGLPDFRNCPEATKIVQLSPEPRVIASSFSDGRGLGRLNDLAADGKGGAYFTVRGAYYAAPDGAVTPVLEGQGVFTNGILLSPDGSTLYVTNGDAVLAFDVADDGATHNQREFARLDEGDSGDGMAVDSDGRLYVTGVGLATSLYVFDPQGARLGVIPTPRQPVSVAFAGPDRRMLYLTAMGAIDADGGEHATPEGQRNTAMSVYKLPMLAQGLTGRPK